LEALTAVFLKIQVLWGVTLSLGKQFGTFRRTAVPSRQEEDVQVERLDRFTPKMKALRSFETPGITSPPKTV
jgi:hypothetical protein